MVLFIGLGSALTDIVAAFVRHGEFHRRADVPSAHLPYPLTAEGEAQAKAGTRELLDFAASRNLRIAPVIDSSNLLRAWQTAGIFSAGVQKHTGEKVSVAGFDDLAERCLGSAANLTLDEIDAVMADDPRFDVPPENWKSSSDYRLPLLGAESLADAGRRVVRHVYARISESFGAGAGGFLKIFVGHGAAFRHAASDMGALDKADIAGLSMFHCRPVFLERTSETQWRHIGGDWKVRNSGDVAMD